MFLKNSRGQLKIMIEVLMFLNKFSDIKSLMQSVF